MATFAQLLAAGVQWISAGDKADKIVNGPATGEGSEVEVDSGTIPTFNKLTTDFGAALDSFQSDAADAIGTFETVSGAALDTFESSALAIVLASLGVPTHANLTAANTALAIGQPYYDTALSKLQVTTA